MPILNSRMQVRTGAGELRQTPEVLTANGPLIPVTITLSDESLRAYRERGEPIPEAVRGLALIDTGASATCFDEASARKAGLPAAGVTKMASVSHRDHEAPVFAGKISTPTIAIDVKKGAGANLATFNSELVALIGRDVLSSAIFVYNGPEGHFSIAI